MTSPVRAFVSPVRIIVLALVVVLLGALLSVKAGDDERPDVVGMFTDASPLEVGSEVRASGVKVGDVASIELEGKVARVGLNVDESVLPLHEDAELVIKPINLLGENYVDLRPGSPDQRRLDSALPLKQTSNAVTLQAVLNTLDQPTSAALAALVRDLGLGVSGSGGQLGNAIKALGPTMQEIDRLGGILAEQNSVLNSLVESADPVARAVAGQEGERLDRLVAQAHRTLRALSAQQTGLRNTVAELPGTLAEARTTLATLDTVATNTAPTLAKARPVTRNLETISNEIVRFAEFATPAFNSFDGVFAEADKLLKEARPIVSTLRSSGPELKNVSRNVQPVADQLLDQHLGDLMAFVRKWALSTNGRDNISHYFRGVFHVTPAALNSLLGADVLPEVLTPGGDDDGNSEPTDVLPDLPGLDPDKAKPGESLKNLLNTLGGKGNPANLSGGADLDVLKKLLNGGAGRGTTQSGQAKRVNPNSATGLTGSQEQNLMEQLLGGK